MRRLIAKLPIMKPVVPELIVFAILLKDVAVPMS